MIVVDGSACSVALLDDPDSLEARVCFATRHIEKAMIDSTPKTGRHGPQNDIVSGCSLPQLTTCELARINAPFRRSQAMLRLKLAAAATLPVRVRLWLASSRALEL